MKILDIPKENRPREGRNRGFRRRPSKPEEARQSSGNRVHKRYERNRGRGRRG